MPSAARPALHTGIWRSVALVVGMLLGLLFPGMAQQAGRDHFPTRVGEELLFGAVERQRTLLRPEDLTGTDPRSVLLSHFLHTSWDPITRTSDEIIVAPGGKRWAVLCSHEKNDCTVIVDGRVDGTYEGATGFSFSSDGRDYGYLCRRKGSDAIEAVFNGAPLKDSRTGSAELEGAAGAKLGLRSFWTGEDLLRLGSKSETGLKTITQFEASADCRRWDYTLAERVETDVDIPWRDRLANAAKIQLPSVRLGIFDPAYTGGHQPGHGPSLDLGPFSGFDLAASSHWHGAATHSPRPRLEALHGHLIGANAFKVTWRGGEIIELGAADRALPATVPDGESIAYFRSSADKVAPDTLVVAGARSAVFPVSDVIPPVILSPDRAVAWVEVESTPVQVTPERSVYRARVCINGVRGPAWMDAGGPIWSAHRTRDREPHGMTFSPGGKFVAYIAESGSAVVVNGTVEPVASGQELRVQPPLVFEGDDTLLYRVGGTLVVERLTAVPGRIMPLVDLETALAAAPLAPPPPTPVPSPSPTASPAPPAAPGLPGAGAHTARQIRQWNRNNLNEARTTYASDKPRALSLYLEAAERGDVNAQSAFHSMLARGEGGMDSAALSRALEAGKPWAQFEAGSRFEKGIGVERSLSNAAFWYGKAAGNGYGLAHYRLSEMHFGGVGVAKDARAATEHLREAALWGYGAAQSKLAEQLAGSAADAAGRASAWAWCDIAVSSGQVRAADLLQRIERSLDAQGLEAARAQSRHLMSMCDARLAAVGPVPRKPAQ